MLKVFCDSIPKRIKCPIKGEPFLELLQWLGIGTLHRRSTWQGL
jgi:hypothetical protein